MDRQTDRQIDLPIGPSRHVWLDLCKIRLQMANESFLLLHHLQGLTAGTAGS